MTDIEILESTYFDLCTIKRKEKIKNATTGITETIEVVKASNVKCALSKSDAKMIINKTDSVSDLVYTHTLFINPNTDIVEGDIIEVSTMGKISIYLASKPFYYHSHTEISLSYFKRV